MPEYSIEKSDDYNIYDKLISIIIPVYNPEYHSFVRCYKSIQELKCPIEIIFVDDGSEYKVEKCIEYTQGDNRCMWIRKKNGGVSSARNYGINKAKGKYILFIDVDDNLTSTFVEYLNKFHGKNDYDWILFDVIDCDLATNKFFYRKLFENKVEGNIKIESIINTRITSQKISECWGKLISRKFLNENDIYFPLSVPTGEDAYFNTEILKYANKIRYVPLESYIYYYNKNHLSERILQDPIKRFNESMERNLQLKALVKKRIDNSSLRRYYERIDTYFIINTTQNCLILDKENILDNNLKMYIISLLNDNNIFDYISFKSFNGIKNRMYYFILKYKLWMIIPFLNIIKMHTIKYKG